MTERRTGGVEGLAMALLCRPLNEDPVTAVDATLAHWPRPDGDAGRVWDLMRKRCIDALPGMRERYMAAFFSGDALDVGLGGLGLLMADPKQ